MVLHIFFPQDPAARLDIVSNMPSGSVDCKVVGSDMVSTLEVLVQGGPTKFGGLLPFSFETWSPDVPPAGMTGSMDWPWFKVDVGGTTEQDDPQGYSDPNFFDPEDEQTTTQGSASTNGMLFFFQNASKNHEQIKGVYIPLAIITGLIIFVVTLSCKFSQVKDSAWYLERQSLLDCNGCAHPGTYTPPAYPPATNNKPDYQENNTYQSPHKSPKIQVKAT